MSGGRAGKGLVGEAAAKEGNRLRMGSYKELEGRLSRQQSMRDVAQGMALQKELMVRRRLPLSPPGEREREWKVLKCGRHCRRVCRGRGTSGN